MPRLPARNQVAGCSPVGSASSPWRSCRPWSARLVSGSAAARSWCRSQPAPPCASGSVRVQSAKAWRKLSQINLAKWRILIQVLACNKPCEKKKPKKYLFIGLSQTLQKYGYFFKGLACHKQTLQNEGLFFPFQYRLGTSEDPTVRMTHWLTIEFPNLWLLFLPVMYKTYEMLHFSQN